MEGGIFVLVIANIVPEIAGLLLPLVGKPRYAGFPWPKAAKGTRL
jgi:hypothetical protein